MIKILLKSSNLDLLNLYCSVFEKDSNYTSKFLKLPTKKHKITLLKSPHVYKKAKVHYQESIYSTLIYINKSVFNKNIFKQLIINVPQSVFIKIIHF